jgi:hypothetical protein
MADLARIEAADVHSGGRIDPAERAVLISLYRELIGTIDGRVVPFPVELMDDPSLVPDRIRPGEVVDLAAARARRAVPPGEDTLSDEIVPADEVGPAGQIGRAGSDGDAGRSDGSDGSDADRPSAD